MRHATLSHHLGLCQARVVARSHISETRIGGRRSQQGAVLTAPHGRCNQINSLATSLLGDSVQRCSMRMNQLLRVPRTRVGQFEQTEFA